MIPEPYVVTHSCGHIVTYWGKPVSESLVGPQTLCPYCGGWDAAKLDLQIVNVVVPECGAELETTCTITHSCGHRVKYQKSATHPKGDVQVARILDAKVSRWKCPTCGKWDAAEALGMDAARRH